MSERDYFGIGAWCWLAMPFVGVVTFLAPSGGFYRVVGFIEIVIGFVMAIESATWLRSNRKR